MTKNSQHCDLEAELDDQIQYANGPLSLTDLDINFPNRPRNQHKTLPFHELFSLLFNPLDKNRKQSDKRPLKRTIHGPQIRSPHEKRAIIIKQFISRWRAMVGDDFFPALRLILPEKDRDRSTYGLKDIGIAKIIIKVLRIDRHSEDALSLLKWNLTGQKRFRKMMFRDFAGKCYEILSKRTMRNEVGDMRIAEVNQLLDQLSEASKTADQIKIFEKFYQKMNAEELMWLIRIVLCEMRIGVKEKTILDIWHPDAQALFNVSSSLRRVCWELTDVRIRLGSEMISVTLMEPFQPQLAQFHASNFEALIKKLGCTVDDQEFWIEEKLDGERMQLHMLEDDTIPGGFRFRFWSRNGKEYTDLYGKGFEDERSSLTRFIRGAFGKNIRNIILDGEMITWDPKISKIVAFGTLKTAALSEQQNPHDDGLGNRPLFRVFDCLYVNDRDITQYVLRERRKVLERALKNVHERIEVHKYMPATTTDLIEEELRKVISESSEGLVLKNPRSAYRLNSRHDDWVKVKPEYMTGFGESLDCIVIGGYCGRGHRSGALSSFLCGLRVDKSHIEKGAHPMKFYSFCRVGGGFRASDYSKIWQITDGKWINWDQKSPPSDLIVLGGGDKQYERPDKWIRPEDSVVLEVKATSICASESFAVEFSLRFPRFKRLRDDKSWTDALSIHEFFELKQRIKTESREADFHLDKRGERALKRVKKEVVILGNENKDDIGKIYMGPKTKAFVGLTFCVMSEMLHPAKKTKIEIEQMIKMNGGSIIQNPLARENTLCIGDKHVVRVASLMRGNETDIIKPIWIIDALKHFEIDGSRPKRFLLPLEPKYLFHATEKTQLLVKSSIDAYNDSYTSNVTTDELQSIMTNLKISVESYEFSRDKFLSSNFSKVEIDLICQAPGMIFHGYRARFVCFLIQDDDESDLEFQLARNYFLFFGGKVACSDDDENITHFVISIDISRSESSSSSPSMIESSRKQHIISYQRRRKLQGGNCHIVTLEWLSNCWSQGKYLNEKDYFLDLSSEV